MKNLISKLINGFKMKKTIWKWKNFEKQKPTQAGIYVVITEDEVSRAWDSYKDMYNLTQLPNVPRNILKQISWARWGYREQLIDCSEDTITYKKEWKFFKVEECIHKQQQQEIYGIKYWIELPAYPKEINSDEN